MPDSYELATVIRLVKLVDVDPETSEREATELLSSSNAEVVAIAQRCIGLAYRSAGHFDIAIRWLSDSATTATKADLLSVKAQSEVELAWCFAGAGQYDRSVSLLQSASEFLDVDSSAGAHNCHGFVLLRTGKFPDALVAFERAVESAKVHHQDVVLAKILVNRATLLVELGDLASAERDLTESVECFRVADRPLLAARAEHNLGWVLGRRGRVAEALQVYAAADSRGGIAMAATSTGSHDRAELYLGARLFREALHSAEQAKHLAEKDRFESQLPEIELLLGRALANLGEWTRATEAFLRCSAVASRQGRLETATVAEWCAMLGSGANLAPSPSSEFLSRSGAELHLIDVVDVAFARLFQLAPDQRFRAALFDAASLGRDASSITTRTQALVSELMISLWEGSVGETENAVEAVFVTVEEHLATLRSSELRGAFVESMHLEAVIAEAALQTETAGSFVPWIERLRNALSQAGFQTDAARYTGGDRSADSPLVGHRPWARALSDFEVRNADWSQSPSGNVARIDGAFPTIETICEQTKSGRETLLCYAMTGEQLVLQQFESGQTTSRRMGQSTEVRSAIEAVRIAASMYLRQSNRQVSSPIEFGAQRLNRSLERLNDLVSPPLVDASPVVIVANGLLASVPWQLLNGFAGRPVTLFPTIADWIACPVRKPIPHSKLQIGLVCGPGLENGPAEVNSISALYKNSRVLVGADCSVAAVSELLEGVDIAHIVGHGSRRESASLSGIELSDGLLMGYDIERLRRVPRRVVLSCCDLGATNGSGLATSFGFVAALRGPRTNQTQGAEVAAPVMEIDDAATGEAMVALHNRLCAGMGLAESLATVTASVTHPLLRLSVGSFNVTGR
jgi:tetratricopeptide (TPR) repeat protein